MNYKALREHLKCRYGGMYLVELPDESFEVRCCARFHGGSDLLVVAIPAPSNNASTPTDGGLSLRACINSSCGWVGKESSCLTWKHAGNERFCPHCHDNTESIPLSAISG